MGRDERRRQKARMWKAARRKARKRHQGGGNGPRVNVAYVPQSAARWPMLEALISKEWNSRDRTGLVEVVVARRGPAGEVAAAVCLVDLGCLGVKSAFARLFRSRADYEYSMSRLPTPKIAADLDLAAKVIHTAIDYAADLGFDPDPDFAEVEPLLAGAQPALCNVPVPVGGDEGKPFFVAGPHDDVEAIMATLSRRLGRDGFHYLVSVGGDLLLDEFDDIVDDGEPEDTSPLSIDDVRLVEPVSVASAGEWLSRWIHRSTVGR